MKIIDGMHRFAVAKRKGQKKISVTFFEGSEAEAHLLAVSENVSHGLPLTIADRKAAAKRILEQHGGMSDRAIADATGLSAGTVNSIRQRSTAQNGQSNARIGRDGRIRPLDHQDRRRHAEKLFTERPDASAREVAREAGISASTAADVKKKMLARQSSQAFVSEGTLLDNPGSAAKAAKDQATELLTRMRSDPAMKSKEAGRDFIHWMSACAAVVNDSPKDLDWLPGYYTPMLAGTARQYAQFWNSFARILETRSSQAKPSQAKPRMMQQDSKELTA